MVTARTQGADIVEAFRLGANDYVTKPIDFQVALARIRTHLSHKWAVEDLRASEERYALAARGANDGLWDWNLVSNEVHWSPRWKAMLGYDESEIGVSLDEWLTRVHPDDVARVTEALGAHLAGRSVHYESEHRIRHRNGMFRWMLCRGAAVRDGDGVVTRLAGSLTDITDAKVADALTGLPNRLLFVDLLDRAIERTQRRQDELFAILILGLDRFKAVNNSLGPLTADCLLVAVASRLQTALSDAGARRDARSAGSRWRASAATSSRSCWRRSSTPATPSGWPSTSGRRCGSRSTSTAIRCSCPPPSGSPSARPGTSVPRMRCRMRRSRCIARRPKPRRPASCSIRRCASARCRACGWKWICATPSTARNSRWCYQPIVSLTTGRITGFEALARWRHPERGLISPVEFIPVAEDTGMIRQHRTDHPRPNRAGGWPIGSRGWAQRRPSIMCVNVSSRQLAQLDLADEIEAVMRETGLESSWLKLEITESAFITDVWAAEATLRRMQRLGVEWSLDDFGTGYSSLSYLHRLQADTVKVDRSFVSRMGADRHGSEMVRAIVALAHNLGMDVVAEGVETAAQLSQLLAIGCEYAQGFYFSEPVERVSRRGPDPRRALAVSGVHHRRAALRRFSSERRANACVGSVRL